MGNTPNGINDRFKEFLGLIVVGIVVIWIALSLIYKLITDVLIPILVGLLIIALVLGLATLLARGFAHLFAYLTLEKRCRRKIAGLNEKISQLEGYISDAGQRIPGLPPHQKSAAQVELRKREGTREALETERRNIATALADHLSDKLDGVNHTRDKLSRKIESGGGDKLRRKLEEADEEASLLREEIEGLKTDYYAEPDPAFERKERKYPIISAFDRFVFSFVNRGMPQ